MLPSYNIHVAPILAKTPKPGAPPAFTQEMYDVWIADEEHIRFEERCDAGKLYFWAALITEQIGTETKTVEIHSLPFDTDHNTGATRLKDFLKECQKATMVQARKTIGDDERRIIGPHE